MRIEKTKALVVGSTGQIGNYLYCRGKLNKLNVHGTSFPESERDRIFMDIRNDKSIEILENIGPDIIIFPAFMPDVDYCEREPRESRKTNVEPMHRILNFCRERKIKFVYYSSDYIFDGQGGPYDEKDLAKPLSEYGKQKLEVENLISEVLVDFIVLRITWVYGWEWEGKNFVLRLVNSLTEGKKVRIPMDQYSNPTYAGNIAEITWELLKKDFRGTLNVSDRDYMSRFNFAQKVAKFHSLNENLIEGVETKTLIQAAQRPLKGGFKLDSIEKILNKKMTNLDESLKIMYSNTEKRNILCP